jgi:phosphodiesterase/alkaline phosphatase D-like protein
VPITHIAALSGSYAEDRWDGYPAQRADLIRFLGDSGLRNVWFITGDFHLGMVMRVDSEGPGASIWEIAAGPAANVSALAPALATAPTRNLVFPRSQFPYVSTDFAATTLAFDPAQDSVQVKFLEAASGRVTFDQALRWGE